jgi:hypothetical protein
MIKWRKDSLQQRCWYIWIVTCKRMKLEPYLVPYTKFNSMWIEDLKVRGKTIKLLEESIDKKSL